MEVDLKTIVNVLIALAIFKLLDRLVLGKVLDKIGSSFEEDFEFDGE